MATLVHQVLEEKKDPKEKLALMVLLVSKDGEDYVVDKDHEVHKDQLERMDLQEYKENQEDEYVFSIILIYTFFEIVNHYKMYFLRKQDKET